MRSEPASKKGMTNSEEGLDTGLFRRPWGAHKRQGLNLGIKGEALEKRPASREAQGRIAGARRVEPVLEGAQNTTSRSVLLPLFYQKLANFTACWPSSSPKVNIIYQTIITIKKSTEHEFYTVFNILHKYKLSRWWHLECMPMLKLMLKL